MNPPNDCPCTAQPFSQAWAIATGLPGDFFRAARALGLFPAWRGAVLEAIGRRPALDGWRARGGDDLGLLLAEMMAYMADVVSFYDALVAGETYLNTASLPGARRELVALLGYRPRPAMASEVSLAAQADGVKPVVLPAGTAFRSAQFLDNQHRNQAPQVFELGHAQTVDPRINRLAVERVRATSLDAPFDHLWVEPGSVRLRPGMPLVLSFNGSLKTARVASIRPMLWLRKGIRAVELRFTQTITPPAGATYAGLRILASGISTRLWQGGKQGSDSSYAISGKDVLLDSRSALRPGEILLFEKDGNLHASHADTVTSIQRVLLPSLISKIKDKDGKESSLTSPEITIGISKLSLANSLAWSHTEVGRITLYHSLTDAAKVMAPIKDSLDQGDPVNLPDLIDAPRVPASRMLLEDVHGDGVEAAGSLSAASRSAALAATPAWGKSLTAPINLLGNVLSVSRGETVKAELLGFGDASKPAQTFKLKKKPLTYLNAANAEGRSSTLSVRVGGVLWQEVPSYYGHQRDEQVFIVRHDDDGETYLHFGGAARPPTGAAIVADYRFGGGAAQPPAGAVNQLARPVAGLKQVRNVLPAFGGADAESPAELAATAPRSALLLGRAVSLLDLEAATASVQGVKAVRVAWRFDEAGLRPAAVIRYIGDGQLAALIRARLRELTEPDAALSVERAQPEPASLSMQLLVEPKQDPQALAAQALAALYAPPEFPGGGGLLRPERLGPDGVIFLSHIMAAVMAIPGITGAQSVEFNQQAFTQVGQRPQSGGYFDFGEQGGADFRITISAGVNPVKAKAKIARRIRIVRRISL